MRHQLSPKSSTPVSDALAGQFHQAHEKKLSTLERKHAIIEVNDVKRKLKKAEAKIKRLEASKKSTAPKIDKQSQQRKSLSASLAKACKAVEKVKIERNSLQAQVAAWERVVMADKPNMQASFEDMRGNMDLLQHLAKKLYLMFLKYEKESNVEIEWPNNMRDALTVVCNQMLGMTPNGQVINEDADWWNLGDFDDWFFPSLPRKAESTDARVSEVNGDIQDEPLASTTVTGDSNNVEHLETKPERSQSSADDLFDPKGMEVFLPGITETAGLMSPELGSDAPLPTDVGISSPLLPAANSSDQRPVFEIFEDETADPMNENDQFDATQLPAEWSAMFASQAKKNVDAGPNMGSNMYHTRFEMDFPGKSHDPGFEVNGSGSPANAEKIATGEKAALSEVEGRMEEKKVFNFTFNAQGSQNPFASISKDDAKATTDEETVDLRASESFKFCRIFSSEGTKPAPVITNVPGPELEDYSTSRSPSMSSEKSGTSSKTSEEQVMSDEEILKAAMAHFGGRSLMQGFDRTVQPSAHGMNSEFTMPSPSQNDRMRLSSVYAESDADSNNYDEDEEVSVAERPEAVNGRHRKKTKKAKKSRWQAKKDKKHKKVKEWQKQNNVKTANHNA